jgi:PrcB C-terminal
MRSLSSILFPVLLAASLPWSACSDSKRKSSEEERTASFTSLEAALPIRYDSSMSERARLVIRDDAHWAEAWKKLATNVESPPVPAVDFATHVVIIAAMGTQPSGGHEITIDDVKLSAKGAKIFVTESSPGSGCAVTAALTAPIAAVLAPRFAGEATFVEKAITPDCH